MEGGPKTRGDWGTGPHGIGEGGREGGLNEGAGPGLGRGLLHVLGALPAVFAGPRRPSRPAALGPDPAFPLWGPASGAGHLSLAPGATPARAQFSSRKPSTPQATPRLGLLHAFRRPLGSPRLPCSFFSTVLAFH